MKIIVTKKGNYFKNIDNQFCFYLFGKLYKFDNLTDCKSNINVLFQLNGKKKIN
jgi:hypothetical protein